MRITDFITWSLDLGSPKEKFHVKPTFRFAKMTLTGPERKLLERSGTRLEAFQKDPRTSQAGEEYKHFVAVLKAFEASSVDSTQGFTAFVAAWKANGNRMSKKEHILAQIPNDAERRNLT